MELKINDLKCNDESNLNEAIGKYLYELIVDGLNYPNKEIYEYDTEIIPDKDTILKLVENHYLLINKLVLKDFYFYWRKKYFSMNSNEIDMASLLILLINPNFSSAWSKRKNILIESLNEDQFRKELKLNRLILVKHFKCEQAFVHRRWLIKQLIKNKIMINYVENELLTSEIEFLVYNLSTKIKSNYYLWTYFNWLVEYLLEIQKKNYLLNSTNLHEIYMNYLNEFKDILYKNPSDFCVFHSRLNLLRLLFEFRKNDDFLFKLISEELELVDDLILRFANFQTVWNYSKYFLLFIKSNLKCFRLVFNNHSISILISGLNLKLNDNIQLLFFKIINNKDYFILNSNVEETCLIDALVKRQVSIGKNLSSLYQLENNENLLNINKNSDNFIQFSNKFI